MPKPRSQRERREETRGRLLAATQTSLVELGYAGATTTAICRRAGVSQGALFKHFASKGELLAATAEWLFGGLDRRVSRGDAAPRRRAGPRRRRGASCSGACSRTRACSRRSSCTARRAPTASSRSASRPSPSATARTCASSRASCSRRPPRAIRTSTRVVAVTVQAIQGATLGSLASGDRRPFAPMLALLTDLVRKAVG